MSRDVRLLRALASDIPQFREVFKSHVEDFGDIYSHALMEEFANFIIEALDKSRNAPDAAQWASALATGLQHLERAYAGNDQELKKLITDAFLKNLWKAGKSLEDLKTLMGPNLKQGLEEAK